MVRDRLLRIVVGVIACLGMLATAGVVRAQQPPDPQQRARDIRSLAWQRGPTEGHVGSTAVVKVREGQAFLDGPNTRTFLVLTGNLPRDDHYTLLDGTSGWFAIFFFESTGYVRDDEKLNPDALLKAMKEGDQRANDERRRVGAPALYTDGWVVAPHYDQATRRLEWGVRVRSDEGAATVNYSVRLLGRRGVMHAILVSSPDKLDHDIGEFKTALTGYEFLSGERYSEFVSGDRVAEYGLAALVLGGAAAVAAKTGFGKALAKFLIIGVVAFGGAVAAFFRKLFKRG